MQRQLRPHQSKRPVKTGAATGAGTRKQDRASRLSLGPDIRQLEAEWMNKACDRGGNWRVPRGKKEGDLLFKVLLI